MLDDPRHTLPGTLAPIGACIVVVSIAIATDSDFALVVRLISLLPAIAVILVATAYLWRALRSRGLRVARRGETGRGPGV